MKQCPECRDIRPNDAAHCISCGYEFKDQNKTELIELEGKETVKFNDGERPATYNLENIGTKSFKNFIWRHGFYIGFGSGGALVLLIIQVIRTLS